MRAVAVHHLSKISASEVNWGGSECVDLVFQNPTIAETAWPSGLRRCVKAAVRKGVGSNPTAVISLIGFEGRVKIGWA